MFYVELYCNCMKPNRDTEARASVGHVIKRHFFTATHRGLGMWDVEWIGYDHANLMTLGETIEGALRCLTAVAEGFQSEQGALCVQAFVQCSLAYQKARQIVATDPNLAQHKRVEWDGFETRERSELEAWRIAMVHLS